MGSIGSKSVENFMYPFQSVVLDLQEAKDRLEERIFPGALTLPERTPATSLSLAIAAWRAKHPLVQRVFSSISQLARRPHYHDPEGVKGIIAEIESEIGRLKGALAESGFGE